MDTPDFLGFMDGRQYSRVLSISLQKNYKGGKKKGPFLREKCIPFCFSVFHEASNKLGWKKRKEETGESLSFPIPPLSAVTNKPEAAGTTINKQIHHLHDAALIQPTHYKEIVRFTIIVFMTTGKQK